MAYEKQYEKIKLLLDAINVDFDQQLAKKLILKLYDLASTIEKIFSDQKIHKNQNDEKKFQSQQLHRDLNIVRGKFRKFKENRMDEIKKFNQVQYYMYQQTEQILHFHEKKFFKQPSFSDLIKEKIATISSYFSKQTHQTTNQASIQISDTQNQFQQKKVKNNFSQKEIIFKKSSYQQCLKIWESLVQHYQNHRLDQAYLQSQTFQNNMYAYDNGAYIYITKQQVQLIKTINFQYKTMTEFYDHFYDTGYTFDKEQKGITLWYKILRQRDVAIKVQAQIDITLENFLCISSQIDLFEDYMPFTYETKQLKSISRNEKIGHSKVYIPLLTDRQTYFYAAAYDRLRTKGSIFFFSKTINEDQQYQQKYQFNVPEQSNYIKLDYKYYILEYTPLTKTRGKIKMVSSIDLKMDYLPLFIINKTARMFSFDYMRNYQKINENFKGSKWDKVKNQKKQLYEYFHKKIEEYLKQKQNKN